MSYCSKTIRKVSDQNLKMTEKIAHLSWNYSHVYPLMSFISELGGSLGLFVGFSFMAIFDYLEFILIMFNSLKYSKDR